MRREPTARLISVKEHKILKSIVATYYDLGELVHVEPITKVTANRNYKIETSLKGKKTFYLLRRYAQENNERQISFEHAILIELRRRNFRFSPEVIPIRSGKSYIKVKEAEGARGKGQGARRGKEGQGARGKGQGAFYVAIFEFLSGEDKYNWNNCSQSDQELVSAANVLALYHGTIAGWERPDAMPSTIVGQIPTLVIVWGKHISRPLGETTSSFERYLIESYSYLKSLSVTLRDRAASKQFEHLPTITVHRDYHAGNLLFQDGQVTALLDFDRSRTDARCFDVAYALFYFCGTWGRTADGHLNLEKCQLFLSAYQQAWRKREGATLGFYPLTDHELQCLPEMILASTFWCLHWFINDYYTNKPDPERWLIDVRHIVRSMKWVETHRERLVEEWQTICPTQHILEN